jgi:hypothetical protein
MEIEIWRCEYKAPCSAAAADALIRHVDEQGRFIRKDELCGEHLKQALASGGARVHDRGPRHG